MGSAIGPARLVHTSPAQQHDTEPLAHLEAHLILLAGLACDRQAGLHGGHHITSQVLHSMAGGAHYVAARSV